MDYKIHRVKQMNINQEQCWSLNTRLFLYCMVAPVCVIGLCLSWAFLFGFILCVLCGCVCVLVPTPTVYFYILYWGVSVVVFKLIGFPSFLIFDQRWTIQDYYLDRYVRLEISVPCCSLHTNPYLGSVIFCRSWQGRCLSVTGWPSRVVRPTVCIRCTVLVLRISKASNDLRFLGCRLLSLVKMTNFLVGICKRF